MHGPRLAAAMLSALVLVGCSSQAGAPVSIAPSPPPERAAYDGPLTATPSAADARQPYRWPGAAGRVVRCSTPPEGGSVIGTNTEGAAADDAEQAIDTRLSEGLFLDLPVKAFARERDDGDRVLFTTSYGGVARQAIVVRYGPSGPGTGAEHGKGWFVESYAACDLADFPDPVSSAAGVEIWSDRSGHRVPTSTVVSAPGPAHCDLQGVTFLTVGDQPDGAEDGVKSLPRSYVDEVPDHLEELVTERPAAHVAVPDDAIDTGYSRNGRHLWLSPDRTRAYLGSTDDAEMWPRLTSAYGCA